ncbi:MAG: hypothetical protein WAW86_09365 [Gammaproteobacteria bacterium]
MLLRYVSKSALKKRIDQFNRDEHEQHLQTLQNALQDGEINHPIYEEENCEIYLTYLFTEGEISRDVFLQGYLYLLATEQCKELGLSVLKDNNDGTYKKILVRYAESLVKHYPNLKILDVIEAYFSFQGMDSWLMVIPIDLDAIQRGAIDEKHKLLFTLDSPPVYPYFGDGYLTNRVTTPIRIIDTSETESKLIIPSIRFIQWLITQCNPRSQTEIVPIFGSISEVTIFEDFHQYSQHPANLNSSLVKFNLTKAHGINSGKFSIAAHDIYYHYMAMALIPRNILNFLMAVVMRELQELGNEFPNDDTLLAFVTKLNDLEFSSDTLNTSISIGTEDNVGRMLGDYFIKQFKFSHETLPLNYLLIIRLCQRLLISEQPDFGINKKRFAAQFLLAYIFNNTINETFLNEAEIDINDLLSSLAQLNESLDIFVKAISVLHSCNLLNKDTFTMLLSKPDKANTLTRPGFEGYLSSLSIFHQMNSGNLDVAKISPSSSF